MKNTANRFYTYTLPGGWTILAGRSDRDNDYLSLKLARPGDWWFHVRGMPGSHVVLKAPEGCREEAGKERLKTAAAVAAWHSRARNGGVTAVTCSRAQYISKPRGAKPGSVTVRRESVLKVRPGLPQVNPRLPDD